MYNLQQKLEKNNVKPTAMRLLVLQCFMKQSNALTLPELEKSLETADKSTLFRTLKTFNENGLVHSIDDGTGITKYALCLEGCTCSPKDQHYHFHCIHCKETFCLTSRNIPSIDLPNKFIMKEANLVLKGICANCNL
ncbi:Fur family transcriptional regulator [Aquimarina sp. 2201CG14-23]|uniref:Fur family transcriptional regulator n=1 Tax=Aquimarina mycalae TaxID=3040073 RepID=UPI002477F852|nr:transcriptional repressor [Aquimarina sp. 2201CG14-23]MDH7445555.1 transcriptional repressor [Aquimarina sp. 2201CG14-23]